MNSAVSSGLKTTSGVIATGKNYLKGVKLLADGTNAASATIYDNTDASGKILWQGAIPATGVAVPLDDFSHMVQAELGLYLALTGTGASAIVYFG